MWSHYADQHRGVLLTFDTKRLEDGLKRLLKDVKYKASPPKMLDMEEWYKAVTFGLPQPDLFGDTSVWTRTKSTEWSYEDEWRLTTLAAKGSLGDYEDFDIPRNALVGVTFGCRTDMEAAKELVALALPFGEQVAFFRLYMPVGSFRLARQDFSLSDPN